MIYFISIVTIAMTRRLKREISDLVSMAADERMSESLAINKAGRIVVMLSLGMMGAGSVSYTHLTLPTNREV